MSHWLWNSGKTSGRRLRMVQLIWERRTSFCIRWFTRLLRTRSHFRPKLSSYRLQSSQEMETQLLCLCNSCNTLLWISWICRSETLRAATWILTKSLLTLFRIPGSISKSSRLGKTVWCLQFLTQRSIRTHYSCFNLRKSPLCSLWLGRKRALAT